MTGARSSMLFSGGVGHPFDETSPILAGYIDAAGWACRIETDLDATIDALAQTDLLAINALYWSMTQDEKYAPLREEWAREISDTQMGAIEQFVHRGGRLFVLHTATICWDTQPRWRALIGGGWQWGVSHHPPLGRFAVALTDEGSELTDGPQNFMLVDEAYHALVPASDCTVLATADLGQGTQPLAWVRNARRGRVAVDALGHDPRSLTQPGHHALIRGQLQWLAR